MIEQLALLTYSLCQLFMEKKPQFLDVSHRAITQTALGSLQLLGRKEDHSSGLTARHCCSGNSQDSGLFLSWSLPPRSLIALDSEHSSPVLYERAALWLQGPRERKQVALSPAEGHLTTFPFCSHISSSNSLGGRHSAWPCGLSSFPLGTGHESTRGSLCFKHILICLKMFHDL